MEETYYVALLQNGNAVEKVNAKNILIERNLRLVVHVVKKYQNVNEDLEDLISIGTIGLIKAVDTYKSDRGCKLATYAARCIDNELLMKFRTRKKVAREVSLYDPIGMDGEGNEITLIDIIEQEQEDIIDQLDTSDKINQLSSLLKERLNQREYQIITMRYGLSSGEEVTQREIGDILGISRSYVSRIEKKALQKLRDGFR